MASMPAPLHGAAEGGREVARLLDDDEIERMMQEEEAERKRTAPTPRS